MAKRKYAKLKALMYEKGIRQIDLEPIIHRKIAYIATRMCGKAPWNTAEIKAIGNLLGIPRDQWLDYFMEEEPAIEKEPEIAKPRYNHFLYEELEPEFRSHFIP